MDKHESDPNNFDGTIAANIRELDPTVRAKANQRISNTTKFHNDLVLTKGQCLVCVEIEKG